MYVDQGYYDDTYHGRSINADDFTEYEQRASEIIDGLTQYRVAQSDSGLADFDAFTQAQFKKAVCAQIEYIDANGGSELFTGDNMASASLGKFNYSSGSSGGTNLYAPMAKIFLYPTGLLYRGL
jgi:hypothetical protein